MLGRGPRRDPVKERFWRETIRRQKTSGLSIREFCARQSLTESAFHAWRGEIRRREQQCGPGTIPTPLMLPTKHRRQKSSVRATPAGRLQETAPVDRPKFLPVAVTNLGGLGEFGRAAAVSIEIVLPSGVVLRVGRDCDRRTLRTVLGALRREETEKPAC
jgi:hypothetical protein